ncbi:MAG: serine/threonine-protein kinase [Sedimentisphaerales bacterium]|nr:serine/threonine-protein kinase [Sedimentisphaerales bacterium]
MADSNSQNRKNDFEEALRQFIDERMRGEKPDIDAFVNQYPEFEDQIRQKVQSFRKIDALFDSLMQSGENEFVNTTAGQDLVGQRVGSFEIVEMIGKGGMGVVYLARDSKLDRLVAVKRLPAELQASSTARTRFTREAKLLASLSHPNIGVIHDIIEPAEGSAYLVLEYIPGETLAERIARESLELKDALSMGLQIAEAVCAAHEAGVIHRDLKPSNIKITPDGRIKVLDFGLAKTTISKSTGSEPTVTQAGRVMGTPAYMSPEQARGKPVDRRSDVWSFGCLLYEMLTGHLPFEGETTTDVLARIIEREPDWDLLHEATPPNIRVLLWRCLAKDPRRRLQHIGDAVIEIDETLNTPPDKPVLAEPLVKVTDRRWWRLGIVYVSAGLVIGLIASGIFLKRPTAPPRSELGRAPTQRFVIELPEDQALGFYQGPFSNRQPAFALSPDGSRLVYVARVGATTQLFERIIDQFEVRPIPGTDGASSPFFSPDGRSVGFFAETDLKVVSLLGGEPVTLCTNSNPDGASWGTDGMIYFFVRQQGLSRVPADAGNVETLGAESERIDGTYPQVLPGNKAILISSGDDAVLFSLETMEKKVLVKNISCARYVSTGHLVYVRAGAIEAVPFNLTTLQVTGTPIPVLRQVLLDSVSGTAQFAVSINGLLVYAPGADTARSIPVWIDRQGEVEPLPMPAQIYGTFRLSPDGRRLVILVRELQSNVYIYDVVRGTGTKLTVEGNNYYPVWTRDGKRIIFSRHDETEEQWQILWALADGSGKPEVLCSSQSRLAPCSLSSDGKLLALYKGNHDLWTLQLEGQHELKLLRETEFMEVLPTFSPDGKWIAYASQRGDKMQIYVRPYPAISSVWQISTNLGEEPIWSPKGDELFYRSGDNKWMVVSISTEPEFVAGTPQVLFEGPYSNVSGLSYDVAPDGRRFLALKPQYDDSLVRKLHVVTNWFEELKRLAPSRREQ